MQLAVEDDGREFFRDNAAIGRSPGVFLGELFNDFRDEMIRAAYLPAGHDPQSMLRAPITQPIDTISSVASVLDGPFAQGFANRVEPRLLEAARK
jgi:hypothetical protein